MGCGLDSTIIAAGIAFPVCAEAELTVQCEGMGML